jgi:hypothetical protein
VACSSGSGGSSARACIAGAHTFSRSRLQVADVSDFVCDEPVVTSQIRTDSAKRLLGTLGSSFEPDTVAPNWSYAASQPVTGTPAVVYQNYPNATSTDLVFFGASGNVEAINNLYATPALAWSAALGGIGMNGSWVEIDDFNQVYVQDSTGALWCFNPNTGAKCTGWTATKSPAGGAAGSQYASPWWSVDKSAIFFSDSGGNLIKVSQTTGRQVWTINLGNYTPTNSSGVATACPGGGCVTSTPNVSSYSSPIEVGGHIYVGNNLGAFFDVTDPGTTTPSNVQATWLCGNPVSTYGCNSSATQTVWYIENAASIDVNGSNTLTAQYLYVAAAGSVYEFNLTANATPTAATWLPDNTVTLLSGATLPIRSSPILDRSNHNIYVGYNNTFYKIPYPLTGSTTAFTSVALQGQGGDSSYPHGSPLPYNGNVYIGDGAGKLEDFGCLAQANQPPQLVGQASPPGATATTMDSSPIASFFSAIDVGYTNGSVGGVAQIGTASSNFTCPGGGTCTTSASTCGSAVVCTHGGACCSSANCPTAPANGSEACCTGVSTPLSTCSGANTCALACNSGYQLCNSKCIPNSWCCTNSNCPAPETCSPTTGACLVPIDNVTLNLNYPNNAGPITNISGNVVAPVTTLTSAGSVTVTNGSTAVTGTGSTFTTSYSTSVNAVAITAGGIGCTTAPTITISGGGATTNATATATVTSGAVSAITIKTTGAGYTSDPTVTFSGGGCKTLPAATASISGGVLSTIVLNQLGPGGAGYTSTPTVTFSGGGCSTQPVGTAALSQQFVVAVTAGGTGYTTAPTVTFSGGGCSTVPLGTATVTSGAVTAVTVTSPGIGCTSSPAVAFSGTGSGATATASSSVASVTITTGGKGCTSSPAVAFGSAGATTIATASAETGLSFSIDGSTWYEVQSIASATALTLRTPYLGTTETGLTTYYESDCNTATQNCNQTYPFTITGLPSAPTCTGSVVETCPAAFTCNPTSGAVTCSTSVVLGLPAGAFAFDNPTNSLSTSAMLAYDSSNRVEASATLANRLYVNAPSATTAYLNMVRYYPIGAGGDAACPLNLAVDANGNVWSTNSNGLNVANTCTGPTKNLSVLVASASPPYSPTVIPNTVWGSQTTGNGQYPPEFIAADATGNVYFTTPDYTNGVWELSPPFSSTMSINADYNNTGTPCDTPRGIDIDPNTSPNGVFFGCAGTTTLPDGSRRVVRAHPDTSGDLLLDAFYEFSSPTDSYSATPVSLVYARAYSPGSQQVFNTDYHGNYELYVNRSSTTQTVISTVEWNPVTLTFTDPCNTSGAGGSSANSYVITGNDNPYGFSYDSGGTPYLASVANSNLINLEFNTNIPLTGVGSTACAAQGGSPSTQDDQSGTVTLPPSPWQTANDDLFSFENVSMGGVTSTIATTNIYTSHYTSNTVSKLGDGLGNNGTGVALNNFIVGATTAPAPTGLVFDRPNGVIWVANSAEASLTRISKNLSLFTNETNTNAWSSLASNNGTTCPGLTATAPNGTLSILGTGFDTSAASNNTVYLAGYMAPVIGFGTQGAYDGVGKLQVTNGGSGYTTAPTVTLSGGGCSTTPAVQAYIQPTGFTFTISAPSANVNKGYVTPPEVTFSGGCQVEPTATATLGSGATAGQVVSIAVNSNSTPATGCTGVPTVTLTGGGYTKAATATVAFTGGVVSGGLTAAVQANDACTSVPTVSFMGGGGTGAAANLVWIDPPSETLNVTVPQAPHGVTGPVIVANQYGQVQSLCTYTTL